MRSELDFKVKNDDTICSCGEKETRPISVAEHTVIIDPAVEATCSKAGLTEGVTRIENGTFYRCTSLESLTLPSTISFIDFPFDKCSSFSITFGGTAEQWHNIEKQGNQWWKNISVVHCTDGDTQPYLY